MRGKLGRGYIDMTAGGITPAHAGKTKSQSHLIPSTRDHPRVCGENDRQRVPRNRQRGSPPRVRGKRRDASSCGEFRRITPACAGKTKKKDIPFLHVADHPRVCGENAQNVNSAVSSDGSPPRVRGKHFLMFLLYVIYRITPACAGKTMLMLSKRRAYTDHPRVCGENYASFTNLMLPDGSPPRVRGKLFPLLASVRQIRITPACAGKTSSICPPIPCTPDHPRVCGENSFDSALIKEPVGSPPRVRGKLYPDTPGRQRPRITPACAGKTARMADLAARTADHPRVCGENAETLLSCLTSYGSPPRVRGKLLILILILMLIRITPACAGKTEVDARPEDAEADHPRVCGENRGALLLRLQHIGSPPRVRGKPKSHGRIRKCGRITPACAGKTGTPSSTRGQSSDHPRVCGENMVWISTRRLRRGSPPRVRGKHLCLQYEHYYCRITPACAGKTARPAARSPAASDHPRVCGENALMKVNRHQVYGSPPRVRGKRRKVDSAVCG